jgi:hypothetical protein
VKRTLILPRNYCNINVPIHPELRKALMHKLIDENSTYKQWLHVILCRELDRPDLIDVIPDWK